MVRMTSSHHADDFASFQKLNRKLMKCAVDESAFKKIPMRVYVIKQVRTGTHYQRFADVVICCRMWRHTTSSASGST